MKDLMKTGYVCHPQQMYTLRTLTMEDGKARGSRLVEVCTAGGLQVDILPDGGLDIGQVRFKGQNVTFISKNGYDGPAAVMPYEREFLHTFPGGLLYTCGLRSTGKAHRDAEEWHPFHGRYHSLQAEQFSARVEDNTVVIQGVLRETALFGHCLELVRTIRIPIFGAEITVTDQIQNMTPAEQELAILYHCNFGYPLISEKAHLELPAQRNSWARSDFAKAFLGQETGFESPVPGQSERVFIHEDMEHRAALVNQSLGIRAELTWSDSLPVLGHWRSMASGDYACGLEPSNCYIRGAATERAEGTLPVLKPYEIYTAELTFSFTSI